MGSSINTDFTAIYTQLPAIGRTGNLIQAGLGVNRKRRRHCQERPLKMAGRLLESQNELKAPERH